MRNTPPTSRRSTEATQPARAAPSAVCSTASEAAAEPLRKLPTAARRPQRPFCSWPPTLFLATVLVADGQKGRRPLAQAGPLCAAPVQPALAEGGQQLSNQSRRSNLIDSTASGLRADCWAFLPSKTRGFPGRFIQINQGANGRTARAPPGVPHTRAGLEPGTSGFSTRRINHYATRGLPADGRDLPLK